VEQLLLYGLVQSETVEQVVPLDTPELLKQYFPEAMLPPPSLIPPMRTFFDTLLETIVVMYGLKSL
jgi:hypothetical protein